MSVADRAAGLAVRAAESGALGDALVRRGVRALIRGRLRALSAGETVGPSDLASGPIAPAPEKANEQHYEVPAEFFGLVLGPWRKYSCALWPRGPAALAEAEEAMLELTRERADVAGGQEVLDLGCGWGAFTLYAAKRHPESRFLAVSNSTSQRRFVEAEARRRDLRNVRVRTADVNGLELAPERFDRIVSVEMFEHMGNYRALFGRCAAWLRPGGRLFVHVFCHRQHTYRFSTGGAGDWMARNFFTGGTMPAADLLPRLAAPLALEGRWLLSGTHYARTAEAWLARLDRHREEARRALVAAGEAEPDLRLRRWRLFFLGVAETFGYARGSEWGVAHYRFARPTDGRGDGAARDALDGSASNRISTAGCEGR